MSRIKGVLARVRSILRPSEAEHRMEEEFRFHVEMEARRLAQGGLPTEEARRRALVAFGGADVHRETMREERGIRWIEDATADVRYALRVMRRSPGVALAVALTLGVGIGVNGMIFGYVNSLFLRPIPGRSPEQLVALFRRDTKAGTVASLGYEDYLDYRDRSGVFAGLAAVTGVPLNLAVPVDASGEAARDMIWGEMVTEDYFSVLGMRPVLGRFFTPADAPQGANPFAVLSYESWRRRFGGDQRIVGRVVRINGHQFTITGVAPKGFRGMRIFSFWPEMWVPIGMHRVVQPGSTNMLRGRGGGILLSVGRLREGMDRDGAQRAVAMFAQQLERAYPATNANVGALLMPARTGFESPMSVKPAVLVLSSTLGLFAALLTLLVICANLANLQLARIAVRARELAIRLSVGCSRARLTRQLLVESAILALPGVALAVLVVWLSAMMEPYFTPKLQFRVGFDPRADYRVMLFTAAIAIISVLLVGLLPALRAAPDIRSALTGAGRPSGRSTGRSSRTRGVLVVTQLALSAILLVGGTLFVRSLIAAHRMDVGFDTRNRALISMNVGLQGYDQARGRRFYDEVLARTRALPGVAAASFLFPAPFDSYGRGIPLYVEGLARSRDGTIVVQTSFVGDNFIPALGLRLQAGRDLTSLDSAGTPRVMVVSRSLAARLWPGKDPIGQRARHAGASGPEITVVGVVADATFAIVADLGAARAYIPVRQSYRDWETLVVATTGTARAMLPPLRQTIASLDPALPTFGATTMEEALSSGFAATRSAATMAGLFGALALLIAAVGLYAVVASSVSARTREIGIRAALGATPRVLLRELMTSGARLGALGLALGLVGALGVAKVMAGLLIGVLPTDALTFVIVPFALAAVVLAATYLPARRAVKLNPIAALRAE